MIARADTRLVDGDWDGARRDYRAALDIDEGAVVAWYGLARAELHRDNAAEAAKAALRGRALVARSPAAGAFDALHAESLQACGDDLGALEAWERAVHCQLPEVDWFLSHAHLLRRLDRPEAAAEALCTAAGRNPSIVIKRAWIAALLESGETTQAITLINRQLESARSRADWLLLRASAWAALNEPELARADLRSAEEELLERSRGGAGLPLLPETVELLEALRRSLG